MYENNQTYGNASPHLDFADSYTHGPLDNSTAAIVAVVPFGAVKTAEFAFARNLVATAFVTGLAFCAWNR